MTDADRRFREMMATIARPQSIPDIESFAGVDEG